MPKLSKKEIREIHEAFGYAEGHLASAIEWLGHACAILDGPPRAKNPAGRNKSLASRKPARRGAKSNATARQSKARASARAQRSRQDVKSGPDT